MRKNNIQENIRKIAEYHGIDTLGFVDASEFKDYSLKNLNGETPGSHYPMQRQLLLLVSILAALFFHLGLNPTSGEQVDCFFLVFSMM